jgi:hypothetical protein
MDRSYITPDSALRKRWRHRIDEDKMVAIARCTMHWSWIGSERTATIVEYAQRFGTISDSIRRSDTRCSISHYRVLHFAMHVKGRKGKVSNIDISTQNVLSLFCLQKPFHKEVVQELRFALKLRDVSDHRTRSQRIVRRRKTPPWTRGIEVADVEHNLEDRRRRSM